MGLTTRPELRGTQGAVAATHWLAAQAGMAALDRGGNAFDAAVTAGFVLQVVEPHLNGLGGEVPIVLWDARRGRPEVICGQGPAPAAASVDAVASLGLAQVPGSGLLAATVPGAFGGWLALLRDHGTLRLREVLEPAIAYAGGGYPLLERAAEMIAAMEPLFRRDWPTSAAVYSGAGPVFRNWDLARTYERLVEAGEAAGADRDAQIGAALDAFYRGFVAEAVEAHCRRAVMDSSGTAHAGLLTAADLASWEARHEEPVTAPFRGWTVAKCSSWSQGPVFLQQLLQLDDLDAGFLSADHVHHVVENAKLAFADREAWYADPDFADVPLGELLAREYADRRCRLVAEAASLELRPGSPGGREPHLPRVSEQQVAEGHWTGSGAAALGVVRGDTVHVCAADRHGNVVACTPSGGWLQSSPVVEGLGFCLGTRAQMLNLDPQHPNHLEGGKRPRTTLSPTLALLDGEPRLAFGTPGGDQQDQWTLEFFLAHAVYGLDLQAALDAPMFHTTHFPSSFAPHDQHAGQVLVEDRLAAGVLEELGRRGHDLKVVDGWSLGRTCAVLRDPATGLLGAGANARGGQAYAAAR